MTFWKWSRIAASNGTADPSAPFPEGMAPSAVNDGVRGAMAALAKYRDDVSGAIVTTGTSTAYAVSSYQGFDTLAHLDGQIIAFTPHATSGAAVTLNVDGLGAKPLRSAPAADLLAGVLILGTPYIAVYNAADAAFYLRGFYGNPYNVPLASGMDYWGSTTPNSSFAFAAGQAISRTTYAPLFAIMGTTFGPGDGSTTFNLPDKRGRVTAGKDDMGGSAANRLGNGNGFGAGSTTLGGAAGAEVLTLAANQIPSLSGIAGTNSITVKTVQKVVNGPNGGSAQAGGTQVTAADPGSGGQLSLLDSTGNNVITVSYSNLSQAVVNNVQPTIVCNYIIRII